MSRAKVGEKRWEEFERQLEKAIKKDEAMAEEEHLAWLDTLPEYIPPPTGNRVKVIFMGASKSLKDKQRDEKKPKIKKRTQQS
jgi:hypothetical protein